MPRKKRPKLKLGSNLEWNGPTIRVVIKVPPSRRAAVGSAHLRESLGTSSPLAAETLKWPVIERLKARAKGQGDGKVPLTTADRLAEEALRWREIISYEPLPSAPETGTQADGLADRAEEIEAVDGPEAAGRFYGIASGKATPLNLHVAKWITESSVAPRTAAKWRKSIKMMIEWAGDRGGYLTIENIDKRAAADFISERMVRAGMHPATANSYLTGLRAYWKWLVIAGRASDNPWNGASLPKVKASAPIVEKRPFTDAEARALLNAVHKQPLRDLCLIAAFSGMRLNEIAELRVSHVKDGMIRLHGTKTRAARRLVPIHSELAEIFASRTKNRSSDAYVIHELPAQKNPARPRAAPMTQAFTYARRALGVDDSAEGVRQSGVDFHSWRRWFIQRAARALEAGATGFTQWTIAEVVGHSKGDGPLAMTMGRYAGDTAPDVLRRCVESVRPPGPSGGSQEAADGISALDAVPVADAPKGR